MFCTQCSYSLTALESSRCPECGLAFDPADPSTFRRTVKRPPSSPLAILVRVCIALFAFTFWIVKTMGNATGNTSWEHHANAGPFILLKESRSSFEYGVSLFLLACLLAPATYWVIRGRWWALVVTALLCFLSIGVSRWFAAVASC